MTKEKVIEELEFFGTKPEWIVCKNPKPIRGMVPPSSSSVFDGGWNIIAKDEKGYYFTHSFYVGGVMDPNRIYNREVPSDELIARLTQPPPAPPAPVEPVSPEPISAVAEAI